ncbi:filamentous hemagglutinin family outer membrane protein [Chondrocystis sp. NIES-4102]|nr:filamentous hemagglutinin family outer membrane protein [Chondrocystis sp. NIES-4102]
MIINGGQRSGNNLFHSLESFSISSGMEAIFNNDLEIKNIFINVSGNEISNIEGTLTIKGNANLFFLNDNGIVFGKDANINIGGSFIASTAQSVRFNDGCEFSARNGDSPCVTTDLPIGLDFGSNPGAITVNGDGIQILAENNSIPIDLGNSISGISLKVGKTLALIGNEVNLKGAIVSAYGGKIEIASLNSGFVGLQETESGLSFNYNNAAINYQDLNILEQALINASGEGQEEISLNGKNILLSDGSFILSQNRGDIDSKVININAKETLKLSGTSIKGKVPSSILSQSLNTGKAANIEINTKHILISDRGRISGTNYSGSENINVKVKATDSIKIINGIINAIGFSQGNSGNLSLVTSNLQLLDIGAITSSSYGSGNSGKISIDAKIIEVAGAFGFTRSNISATSFGFGNAGSLYIKTEQLKVLDGGSVSSSAFAQGDAGSVIINASKFIEVDGINQNFKGNNPESTIRSAIITLPPAAQKIRGMLLSPTGNAGEVIINTPELNVINQGIVSIRNDGTGNEGVLSINAEKINLDNSGSITGVSNNGKADDGENINITADIILV